MNQAGRREWIGLAVIALACMLYSMDLTVLNLAVPSLSADLKPTSAELLWIVDIYGFLVAGSLITLGTLGDRIGRRKLLMIGAAVFGIASVLAAFSTSAAMLIATRAYVIAGGMTVTALGFILLALVDKVDSSLAMLVAGSVVFSLGLTPVVTLTTDIVLSAAPPERAGAASALSETSSEFGGALGIAVLGSIVTAIYRGEIASAFPVGVPAEAAEIARGTIGGAVSVANDLPGVIGDELLGSARDAFSQAFGTTAVISAVMAIGVALLAVMLLRPVEARLRSTRIAIESEVPRCSQRLVLLPEHQLGRRWIPPAASVASTLPRTG